MLCRNSKQHWLLVEIETLLIALTEVLHEVRQATKLSSENLLIIYKYVWDAGSAYILHSVPIY